MGIIDKLFKEKKELTKPIVESTEKNELEDNSQIELITTKEEEKALEYFGLTNNFTEKELAEMIEEKNLNKYKMAMNDDISIYDIEENIQKYSEVLNCYLNKRKEFQNAVKQYLFQYNSKSNEIGFNYDYIKAKFSTYTLDIKKIDSITKHIIFEVQNLEKMLFDNDDANRISIIINKFETNINTLLNNVEDGKIEDFEEYKLKQAEEEKMSQTINKTKMELNKTIEELYKKNDDRKKYYFDGCENASKEELIEAFKELSEDEKYVKRNSELYKNMTRSYSQMIVSKDTDKVRKLYAERIAEVLKEYDKKGQNNSFSYSLDNHHPKSDDDDDGALAAAPNKKSKK